MSADPRPWLEEGASGELRSLLESARDDGPSPAQLSRVAASLGPLLVAPVAVTAPAVAGKTAAIAAKTGIAAKLAIASISAVAVVGGAFEAGRVYQEKAAPPRVVMAPTPVVVPAPAPVVVAPEPEPVVEPEPEAEPVPVPVKPHAVVRTPEAEATLLEQAMSALKAEQLGKALALCDRHARDFGANGLLVQEREVIAIEALVRLGRTAEAKKRAEKFKAQFPTSTHLLKVESLVAP